MRATARPRSNHTLAVMIPEFGHGGGHSSRNLAVFAAGNFGDVPMGRYVQFSEDLETVYNPSGEAHNKLHVSILNAFGDSTGRFGDYSDARVTQGPLPL